LPLENSTALEFGVYVFFFLIYSLPRGTYLPPEYIIYAVRGKIIVREISIIYWVLGVETRKTERERENTEKQTESN